MLLTNQNTCNPNSHQPGDTARVALVLISESQWPEPLASQSRIAVSYSDSKESACNAGDLGLITGLGRPPGKGHGNPLQYSCLENPHGLTNLVGYSPRGHKESERLKRLSTHGGGVGWGRGGAFLVSSQVLLMLLIQGPHLEQAWFPLLLLLDTSAFLLHPPPPPRDFVSAGLNTWRRGYFSFCGSQKREYSASGPIPEKVRGRMDPICRAEH